MIGLLLALTALAQSPEDEDGGLLTTAAILAHEQELMQVVERNDPALHRRLLVLRETDRLAYAVKLYRVWKTVEKAKEDPAFAQRMLQIQQREQQMRVLATGWATLSNGERQVRRKELEKLAYELMDLKQAERRARVEELRERLREIEQEIADREADRDRIVREYVDQLVQPPVDL